MATGGGDAAEQEAAHSDVDHGAGDSEALLVIAHETMPACHPAKRALHFPSAWEYLKALLVGQLADG